MIDVDAEIVRYLVEERGPRRIRAGLVISSAAAGSESGRPVALLDLSSGGERAQLAKQLGMQAGYAIPVIVHGDVVAVLECASRDVQSPNARLLEVLGHIGVQLGRVGERTALQERLRQSQRLEAVGRLAAGVAHEINNPMAYVRSNLNQLHGEWKALRAEFEKLLDERRECSEQANVDELGTRWPAGTAR